MRAADADLPNRFGRLLERFLARHLERRLCSCQADLAPLRRAGLLPRSRVGQDGIDSASDFELLLPEALHAASLRASMFCFATVKVRATIQGLASQMPAPLM